MEDDLKDPFVDDVSDDMDPDDADLDMGADADGEMWDETLEE
jgi:hypothetical protein